MQYDYLVVGAGMYGATFARMCRDAGQTCLVIDSRSHVAGNAYTERREGIDVHIYGAHIFHTNSKSIWDFVNRFSEFNNYVHTVKSYARGRMYSLPFNMNTFYELWGCTRPDQAQAIIEKQRYTGEITNLEQQACALVGSDLYKLLIREYTAKQWQMDPSQLPEFIIRRLPLRFTYDNRYFDDKYQGIPVDGYTKLVENMLDGIEVKLNVDYFEHKQYWDEQAKQVVYTGKIDQYYNYCYGELEYRTLEFETTVEPTDNHQGLAVLNYPDISFPYTRIVEHKHFNPVKSSHTIITKEIPIKWQRDFIPYYPINDKKNTEIYKQYRDRADTELRVIFGGRLAEYKYYDMHQVIASAQSKAKSIIKNYD